MSKRRKYTVFLFPEKTLVGHILTSTIVDGEAVEGNNVTVKWKEQEVPARILRFIGMFFKL